MYMCTICVRLTVHLCSGSAFSHCRTSVQNNTVLAFLSLHACQALVASLLQLEMLQETTVRLMEIMKEHQVSEDPDAT